MSEDNKLNPLYAQAPVEPSTVRQVTFDEELQRYVTSEGGKAISKVEEGVGIGTMEYLDKTFNEGWTGQQAQMLRNNGVEINWANNPFDITIKGRGKENIEEVVQLVSDPEYRKLWGSNMTDEEWYNVISDEDVINRQTLESALSFWQANVPSMREANELASVMQKVTKEYKNAGFYLAGGVGIEAAVAKAGMSGLSAIATAGALDGAASGMLIKHYENKTEALNTTLEDMGKEAAIGATAGAGAAIGLDLITRGALSGAKKAWSPTKKAIVKLKKNGKETDAMSDDEAKDNLAKIIFEDAMYNGPDITNAEFVASVKSERATVKEGINKAKSDISDLEALIQAENNKIEATSQNVRKEYSEVIKGAKSKVKSESTSNKHIKELNKSGRFVSTKTEELEAFINDVSGRAAKVGVKVKPGKDIQKTKDALVDSPEILEDFVLTNTAKKVIDNNKAKDNLEILEKEIADKVEELAAENRANIEMFNKRKEKVAKELEDLNTKNSAKKQALRELEQMDPNAMADTSAIRYAYFKNSEVEDGRKVRMSPKVSEQIREVATKNNDKEVLDRLDGDNVSIFEFMGVDYKARDVGIIDALIKVGEDLDQDIDKLFYAGDKMYAKANESVKAIGVSMSTSGDDAVLGYQSKYVTDVTGYSGKDSGKYTPTGSITVITKTQNEFTTKFYDSLLNNFEAWKKRVYEKPENLFRTSGFRQVKKSDFEDMIDEARAYIENGNPLPDHIPQEAINVANDFIEISKEMSIRAIEMHPTATPEQKSAARLLVEIEGKAPRVVNNDFYRKASSNYDEGDIVRLKEGGILKAEPTINEEWEIIHLNNKKEVDGFLTKSEEKRLKDLSKEVARVKKLKDEGKITDAWVDTRLLRGDNDYSKLLSKVWYTGRVEASKRTLGGKAGKPESKAGFDTEEAKIQIEELTGALTDKEVALLDTFISRKRTGTQRPKSKEEITATNIDYIMDAVGIAFDKDSVDVLKAGSADPYHDLIKTRGPLDTTYEMDVKVKVGEGTVRLSNRSFYDNNTVSVAETMINDRASLYGMYYSGTGSRAEFIDETNALLNHIVKKAGTEDTLQFKNVTVVGKKILGKAQYDRSASWIAWHDGLKAVAVTEKLGYLVIAQTADNIKAASQVKFWNFFKSSPAAWRATKKFMRGEADPDDHLLSVMRHTTTYSPLFNVVSSMEAGSPDAPLLKQTLGQGFKEVAGTVASAVTRISSYYDVFMRSAVLDASMTRLLNGKDIGVNLKAHGFTDEMLNRLKNLDDKYIVKNKKGQKIGIDTEKLFSDDAKFAEDLTSSMYRTIRRAVGTPDFESLPWWKNTIAFELIGQFKTWMLSQYSNATLYAFQHQPLKKIMYFQTLLTTYGALYHMGMTYIKYGDDEEKFEEYMSPANIFKGGFANNPTFAAPMYLFSMVEKSVGHMIGIDLAGQLAGANTRTPYSSTGVPVLDEIVNTPAGGSAKTIWDMFSTTTKLIQGEEFTSKELDDLLGPIPNSLRRGITLGSREFFDLD